MGQERCQILLEPVRQEQRDTGRREHLHNLMHDALGHCQRAWATIDGTQHLALRIYSRPHPVRRPGETLNGLVLVHLTVSHRTGRVPAPCG